MKIVQCDLCKQQVAASDLGAVQTLTWRGHDYDLCPNDSQHMDRLLGQSSPQQQPTPEPAAQASHQQDGVAAAVAGTPQYPSAPGGAASAIQMPAAQ